MKKLNTDVLKYFPRKKVINKKKIRKRKVIEIECNARDEEFKSWSVKCPHCGQHLVYEGDFNTTTEPDICPICKGKFKIIRLWWEGSYI